MWAQVAIAIIMMIASYAITRSQLKNMKSPTMEAGKLDIPQPEEGKDIAMIFGTELIEDPALIYYGGARVEPVYAKEEGMK